MSKNPSKLSKKSNLLGRHGSSFTQIFIILAVICTTLVIIFISALYVSTRDSVKSNIEDSKIMTTNQIKNTFEREIQTIEKLFNAYSTTNDFHEMVQEPLGIKDFQKYRMITSQLNYFATFSLPSTVYSVVSLDQNWLIRDGRLTQMTEEEIENIEERYVEGRKENLYWIQGENHIRSISLLPVFSNTKLAIGMAEIPNSSIQSLLDVSNESTPFFIVNRNDELLFSANIEENDEDRNLSIELIHEIRTLAEEKSAGIIELSSSKNNSSTLIYTKSDYNNWLYVTYLNTSEIDEALKFARYGLVILALIIISAIIVGAYIIAGRITRPIEKLKTSLNFTTTEDKKVNDWDFITGQVDAIVSEKKTLEGLYEREQPELEKQFMRNLYRNRVTKSELSTKMDLYNYPDQKNKHYSIMLIQIDDYGSREVNNQDVFLVGINQIVNELIPIENRLTPVVLNDKIQVTLLAFDKDNPEENKKECTEYANLIIDTLRTYMRISVSIAFSPFYTDLLSSKENLDKGKQTLAYHLLLGNQAIIFHDEVEKMIAVPEISGYPEDLEAQLFQSIRLGEREQVREIAPAILKEIFTSSNNPINVQVALLRFALNLVQLSQTVNASVLNQEKGVELYELILQVNHPSELEATLLNDIILPFVQEMNEKTSEQFQGLSEQIIKIIENEYTEDISLESIGDRIHYNPNYLSNIFKKETGITFSDYLTGYRFDIAKQWLRETNVTIKEISQRLQYRNPQNFIRSFKKKENMTPGEYRKMHTPE